MAANNIVSRLSEPRVKEAREAWVDTKRLGMVGFRVRCECTYDLTHTDRENPFVQEGCASCNGKLSVLVWGEMLSEWEATL